MSQGNFHPQSSQPGKIDTSSVIENETKDWSEMITNLDSSFKKDLENGDQTLLVVKLHKMFDECLPLCPIDDLDTRIFSVYLTEASRIFTQLIADINKKVLGKRKNESDIKTLLTTCTNVLDCWQKCLKHLKNLQKVSISKVKSLPDSLFNAVKSALSFSKMSELNYGEIMKEVTDEVTVLFRKSNEILSLFLTILDSIITFDVDQEAELNILITIISEIGDTAALVDRLDLKSISGIWKQFGKLATFYGGKIKSKFPERVTQHFASLAEDIISLIFSAIKDNQPKLNEKKILCGRVMFKILDKLWNIYYLSASDEIAYSSVKLLVQMHRYSPPCLIATKVDPSIVKLIEINFSAELESYLNTMFQSKQFLQTFLEFGKREDTDAIGYHLLTLSLMRKLLKLSYEIQRTWIIGDLSIIDVALANIDLLQLEICLGKIQLSVSRNFGEAPKSSPIYEETFLMIWGLICQVPASDFGVIENLLVKHLMSGKFWSSLLTTDVWCMISRCASQELCFDHLKYFMKVHERLAERENSLEVFILSFLISRIYETISDRRKDLFVENLNGNSPDFWSPLSRKLTDKGKSILLIRMTENSVDISKVFQNLKQKPSVKNWMCLTSLLNMYGICSREQDSQTMKTLSNIWNSIAQVIEDCEGIYLILVSELMKALFHCEVPCKESFKDGTVSLILKSVTSMLSYIPPYVKVKSLHWLKNICVQITDQKSNLTIPISELYCLLLADETPWVRQEALEHFNDFTRHSPNEDLVRRVLNIIMDKATLSDSVPAYISSTSYYKLSGFPTTDAFLRQLFGSPRETQFQHTCYEVNEREEKFPKLEESTSKFDFNLNQKIERVCNELDDLLNYKNEISQECLDRLRQTFVNIFDQRKNSS